MTRFLIDEDLPGSLVPRLRELGHDAAHVREIGLRGASDDAVFEYAVEHSSVLITGDLGFGNETRFAPSRHHGIVIARIPTEMRIESLNIAILGAVGLLKSHEMQGAVIVVEPGRIRRRKAEPGVQP